MNVHTPNPASEIEVVVLNMMLASLMSLQDQARIESAIKTSYKKFEPDAFVEIN